MFHPVILLIALGHLQTPTSPPTPAQAPQTPQTPVQTPAPTNQPAPGTTTPAVPTTTPAGTTPTTATAAPVAFNIAAMFVKPLTVAEPVRLAITPKIDGKIDPEEWDAFATLDGGVDTFFQWEPDKLHFAAQHIPVGQDLLISVDGHGDGWLVGKDNLEIRVHWTGTTADVSERILDNTPVSGPVWVDVPNFKASTILATSQDDKGRTVELTITDPATDVVPDKANSTVGLRFDVIPETTAPAEALLPRVLIPTHLQYARGNGLPGGLSWHPEVNHRTVVPGETGKIRLDFNGHDELNLKRIEMRSEGIAQNDTESTGEPFPSFDKKGRAFVDYKTRVTKDAVLGYRVMKATVTDAQGKQAVLETSYEIAPIVTFDFHEKSVAASSEPQLVKFSAYIRSNTVRRVDGVFRVQAPEGWKVKSGTDVQFLIYDSRASERRVFEIEIPGGFKGTAPIKLIADFAGQHAEQTEYIVVQ